MRRSTLVLTVALAGAFALGACTGGNGVEPGQAGFEKPSEPQGNVETVVRILREAGPGPVTWDEATEVVTTECSDCAAVMTDLHQAMQDLLDAGRLGDMAEVVQEILDGQSLPTDALVEIIRVVDQGGVKGSEPGGEPGVEPGPGAEKPVVGEELELILAALAERGDNPMSWAEIEELILAECPDCVELLAQLREAYLASLAEGKLPEEHATTATALEESQAPPASNSHDLLAYVSSGEAGAEAPAPGDGAPQKGAGSVDAALAKLGTDNTYVRFEYVLDACGGNDACVAEYQDIRAKFEVACSSADDCTDEALARLLFGPTPSATQKRAGQCPSTGCVQIRELKRLIEMMEKGIEPMPPFEGDVRDAALKIAGELTASGIEELSWDDLRGLLEDCEICIAGLDAVGQEIDRMLAAGAFPEELVGGATGLREGSQIKAAEAIAVFDVVAAR